VPAGPDGREPSYIELLARSETRRRIRASGSSTYLGEMLAESGDSMLRRWENRQSNPIRVYFATRSRARSGSGPTPVSPCGSILGSIRPLQRSP
jgi:hypothetical protein